MKKYLPQLLSLFLFLFLTSAFLPAGVLLGDQNVESTLDSNAAGRAQAFPTTASASGLLSSLSMYVDPTSTASQIAIGLYSDAGGHPSSLLTQAVFTPQAGVWNTASVPPVAVALGTPYWIAVLGLGSGRPYFRDSVTGCTSEGSSSDSLAALPAAWSTGGIWTACALSAYGSASGNGWSVVYVDSQETSCYNGAAANAIDGNPSTMWHTQFCGAAPATPHEIQINLGGLLQPDRLPVPAAAGWQRLRLDRAVRILRKRRRGELGNRGGHGNLRLWHSEHAMSGTGSGRARAAADPISANHRPVHPPAGAVGDQRQSLHVSG